MRTMDGGAAREFGAVLRGLRMAGGMTQEQLGLLLQVRRDPADQHPRPVKGGTVSGWERGSPLGDFKGETRGSTIAQFERVEAELVRRAGRSGRALPEWYSDGDLVRAVVAVIDDRGTESAVTRPGEDSVAPNALCGRTTPTEVPAHGDEPEPRPPRMRSFRRRPIQIVVAVLAAVALGAVLAVARSGPEAITRVSDERSALPGSGLTALYQDDFSDPLSGWHDGGDDKGSTRYVGGSYQVLVSQPNRGRIGFRPWTGLPPNVRIEVEATKAVPVLGSFGLACRENGGSRYEGRIDVNHSWRITRGTTILAEGAHDAIKGDGAQLLALECRGGSAANAPVELALFVNGTQVGRATDSDGLAPGHVGVVLASQAQEVQVLFDNFVVRPL